MTPERNMENKTEVFKKSDLVITSGLHIAPLEIHYFVCTAAEKILVEVFHLAQSLKMLLLCQVSLTGKKDHRDLKNTRKARPIKRQYLHMKCHRDLR